jgi:hypothetical protein
MLYLPGLKNTVTDFSSRSPTLHWIHLELMPPWQRQIQLILKPLFHVRRAKPLRRNAAFTLQFIPQTCLLTSRCQRLVSNVSTGVFRPIIPAKFRKDIFCICKAFPILGGWALGTLCPLGLSGAASPLSLCRFLRYSSASMHCKGKTLVFPRLRQFLVLNCLAK